MLNRAITRTVWQRVVPHREPVTLLVRSESDVAVSFTPHALSWGAPDPVDYSEVTQDGVVVSTLPTKKWQLWQEILDAAGAPRPKIGDVIQDQNGVKWLIQRINNTLFNNVWNCETIQRS